MNHDLLDVICEALLVGGWTASWLTWAFSGSLRHWAVMCMPRWWRNGKPRADIDLMTASELDLFLAGECNAPFLVRQLLTCRVCMSAHVALVGALVVALADPAHVAYTALVWATGAWIGRRLHNFERK